MVVVPEEPPEEQEPETTPEPEPAPKPKAKRVAKAKVSEAPAGCCGRTSSRRKTQSSKKT